MEETTTETETTDIHSSTIFSSTSFEEFTTEDTGTTEESFPLGVVIGVVIASIVVIAIIVFIVVFLVCRRSRLQKSDTSNDKGESDSDERERKISTTSKRSRKISSNLPPGKNTLHMAFINSRDAVTNIFPRKASSVSINDTRNVPNEVTNPVMGRRFSSNPDLQSLQNRKDNYQEYGNQQQEIYNNVPVTPHSSAELNPTLSHHYGRRPTFETLPDIAGVKPRTSDMEKIPEEQYTNNEELVRNREEIGNLYLPLEETQNESNATLPHESIQDNSEQEVYVNTCDVERNTRIADSEVKQEEYMNMGSVILDRGDQFQQEMYVNMSSLERKTKNIDSDQAPALPLPHKSPRAVNRKYVNVPDAEEVHMRMDSIRSKNGDERRS